MHAGETCAAPEALMASGTEGAGAGGAGARWHP